MMVAMLIAACGNTTTTPPATVQTSYNYKTPTHKGGSLLISDWQFPDSTNPLFTTTVVDVEVQEALWANPVTVTSDAKYAADQLTEVPTTTNGDVSKDGLTVTMKLRHDLVWSDGQPLTSDDYIYYIKTLLDNNTGAASQQGFTPDTLASYTNPDPYTVVLKYVNPFASYLAFLPVALPKHLWGSITDAQLANQQNINLTPSVTDGPFVVSDYASQQSFTLTPNPKYKSTTLHATVLDQLIFKGYSNKDTLIAGFKASETDFATDFTVADLSKLAGIPGLQQSPAIESEHMDFNLATPVLQDVNVRKAIAQGIDRCQIITKLLGRMCSQNFTDNLTPTPSPLFDPNLKGYSFSVAMAKADLQASGWDCSKAPTSPCTKGGQNFPTLNLATRAGNQVRADTISIIKDDLAQVGIPINIDNELFGGSFFGDFASGGILATGKYDLSVFAYSYPLDYYGALGYFQSSQIPSAANPAGGNYERVNDPMVDQLISQGNQAIDPATHTKIYKQLLAYISQQMYELPLYIRPNINLVDNRFGNFFPNPTSQGQTWDAGDWFAKS